MWTVSVPTRSEEVETEPSEDLGLLGIGSLSVTGLRRLRQYDHVLRTSYTFTTRLTLQVFLQALVTGWSYRDLRTYLDDRSLAPGAPASAGPIETDFGSRRWAANALGRWEFRPGSALYVVYTRAASDSEPLAGRDIHPLRNLTGLWERPSDDVIQAKPSWLFR